MAQQTGTWQAALVALEALEPVGSGLSRPECVLCTEAGDLYVSDWGGGVARIAPDGSQQRFLGCLPDGGPLQPNGIALCADGTFLVAHLGADEGGVYALDRSGRVRPFLTRVDGVDLPPTNFVVQDTAGRTWVTVSTRRRPRAAAYRGDCADGFIAVVDGGGARIAADGLGYTNEVAIDPSGRWLYVNETFARRLSRFPILPGARLGDRETVAEFGEGVFPDGLCFDAEAHAWITSIVSNRVIRIAPDGAQSLVVEDCDPAHVADVEAAYLAATMGRPHLDQARGRRLRNVSSLAFGGAGLRSAYLGCLLGQTLFRFDSPVAGHPPVHWTYRVPTQ